MNAECYQDRTCTRLKICFWKFSHDGGDISSDLELVKLTMFCGFWCAWVTLANHISWSLPPMDMIFKPLDAAKIEVWQGTRWWKETTKWKAKERRREREEGNWREKLKCELSFTTPVHGDMGSYFYVKDTQARLLIVKRLRAMYTSLVQSVPARCALVSQNCTHSKNRWPHKPFKLQTHFNTPNLK